MLKSILKKLLIQNKESSKDKINKNKSDFKPFTDEENRAIESQFGDDPYFILEGPNIIRFDNDEIDKYCRYSWKAFKKSRWKELGFDPQNGKDINIENAGYWRFNLYFLDPDKTNSSLNNWEKIQQEKLKEKINPNSLIYDQILFLAKSLTKILNYNSKNLNADKLNSNYEKGKYYFKHLKPWVNKTNFKEITGIEISITEFENILSSLFEYYNYYSQNRKEKFEFELKSLKTNKGKNNAISKWNDNIKSEIFELGFSQYGYNNLLIKEVN